MSSSTIGRELIHAPSSLAEAVPETVAGLITTVRDRLPDRLPDSLPDLPDLTGRLPSIRLPEVDVADLAERLRDLPAVGAVTSAGGRSKASRVAVPVVVAGVAIGAFVLVRRIRARKSSSTFDARP